MPDGPADQRHDGEDEVLASGGDYLDEEERLRLHEALHEGIEQMKAGQTIEADEALAELRAHR
jgi:hypothetical protein